MLRTNLPGQHCIAAEWPVRLTTSATSWCDRSPNFVWLLRNVVIPDFEHAGPVQPRQVQGSITTDPASTSLLAISHKDAMTTKPPHLSLSNSEEAYRVTYRGWRRVRPGLCLAEARSPPNNHRSVFFNALEACSTTHKPSDRRKSLRQRGAA